MKRLLIVFLLFISFLNYSQSNKDIANVYIKRANESISNLDAETARVSFDKAMRYLDTITSANVARLGMQIYYEIHHKEETPQQQLELLQVSKKYSNQYFLLEKNRKSEDYKTATEDYVLILEAEEELQNKIKFIEAEEARQAKELKRIDSLKTVWRNKSTAMAINVDSIYDFNKNNIALFKKANFYGLMNDVGEVIVPANEFKDVVYFDNYFIFKNKNTEATKLFCFNSNTKKGFVIPPISDFNTLSTHYGKIMLPRGNGRLITYPNNSTKPFVFDLNVKKTVVVANEKELFKNLDKSDAIDKYNKDGEVKVNKEWYKFGGHLGGGIHPLYAEEGYELKGFLCAIDGKFLDVVSDYQYIGAFYNGKFEAIQGENRIWINQNGTKVSDAKDDSGKYSGTSKVVKLEDGSYQIMREGIIILGDEKLEKMPDFLRKFKAE